MKEKEVQKKKRQRRKKEPTVADRKKTGPKKRRTGDVLFFLVMVIGFGVFAYPFISNGYYKYVQKQAIQHYEQGVGGRDKVQQERIQKEMKAYNEQLAAEKFQELEMPFIKAEKESAKSGKSRELGEVLAVIDIPKILVEMPVYHGTSEVQLQAGAGVLAGTSMPYGGETSHSVITGHRGLPKAKMFTDLPKLEQGDPFYLHLLGETHAYEVDQIKVVEPSDLTDLKVVDGKDYVTLLTCTPYMVNSHRLLVRGHRVPYQAQLRQAALRKAKRKFWLELLFYVLGAAAVLFSLWLLKKWRQKKQDQRRLQTAAVAVAEQAPAKKKPDKRESKSKEQGVKKKGTTNDKSKN